MSDTNATTSEQATALFALPCHVSTYQTEFVVHDNRWRRVATFPVKNAQSEQRAIRVARSLDAYDPNQQLVAELVEAAHFARSVIENLPPTEMSERMAIEKLTAALAHAADIGKETK